jgi:hypothetical protein
MAKKFRAAATGARQLGLTEDEVRFYDALANNESAVRELSDETLKKIAHELTENLRQNLTVDWSARESVRPTAADGQAHPAQVQVPAGPAGGGGGAGAAAGEALGEEWRSMMASARRGLLQPCVPGPSPGTAGW